MIHREAQLETPESALSREHRNVLFERRLDYLTETVVRGTINKSKRALQMSRFLEPTPAPPHVLDEHENEPQEGIQISALVHRPRKRQSRHVDAESRRHRQPSEPLPPTISIPPDARTGHPTSDKVLGGLGPFGTKYAVDFDIQPLALGTYFHQSTFIGSGEFAAGLASASRDLSRPTGCIRVHLGGEVLEWAAWTEDVATGFDRIPGAIAEAWRSLQAPLDDLMIEQRLQEVQANFDYVLRSVIRYCAKCLTFSDPVDRLAFVQKVIHTLEQLLELPDLQHTDELYRPLRMRCLQYMVVLSKQAQLLSGHPHVQVHVQAFAQKILETATRRLATCAMPALLDELRVFYEDNGHSTKREAGIQDHDVAASTIVILYHSLHNAAATRSPFWKCIIGALNLDVASIHDAATLDKVWYDLMTFLPVLEIDPAGIASPGRRLQSTADDWPLVKSLTERTLDLYPGTCAVHTSTINSYVRALFTRCSRLQSRWGWWKSESILGCMFDFFARRGLAQLHNEDSRGSPKYLSDLEGQPSIEVQPEDCAFHVFLKMLAAALISMSGQSRYSGKKIGGIAWRFIPNHGRTCRKDVDVRQTDIDALRNHHDLLCTLYYASPAGHRLRVELVRNLVDHATSHREACRLSVRAWSNLVSFQASRSESEEALISLVEWCHSITDTTLQQYRHARAEAEQDFAVAKAQGVIGITEDMVNATIASNQRQIVATLVDALAGLARALRAASSLTTAIALLRGSAFWKILDAFDPEERRLQSALDESLQVVQIVLDTHQRFTVATQSQHSSEESQDYGDSSAIDHLVATDGDTHVQNTAPGNLADIVHGPVSRLVSNVFGADAISNDGTLTKVIDVWLRLAEEDVHRGKHQWSEYLDDYSSTSWTQLRDTDQKRKFAPYYLAGIVQRADDLSDVRDSLFTTWLTSLVEREANLKYQHLLTEALLHRFPQDPLSRNAPFSKATRSAVFKITLHELRQRRLALISSVLSNMRDDFNDTLRSRPSTAQEVRRTYAEMLRVFMAAMKTNYQALQSSPVANAPADPHMQGAYVEFVQYVVSYLQQYTSDLCRIDPFFTDSSAFPLPAADPTYVVGRLKSYVPKLADSKTRKQLAVFLSTIGERAAVDGQQTYLVDQLCQAMNGVQERGIILAPSLRHVLMTAVFPPYIEMALETACSWILAIPVLRACERTLGSLLYDMRIEDAASVDAIVETAHTVLESARYPLQAAWAHPGLLTLAHVQMILTLIFGMVRASLTGLVHIRRSTGCGNDALSRAEWLYVCARNIESNFDDGDDQATLEAPALDLMDACQSRWADTRLFARTQLKETLGKEWYAKDGQSFVRRGTMVKEVVIRSLDENDGIGVLRRSIGEFCRSYECIVEGKRDSRLGEGGLLHGLRIA